MFGNNSIPEIRNRIVIEAIFNLSVIKIIVTFNDCLIVCAMALEFKKLINVLIHLAEADSHYSQQEHDLIMRILERKGLPESFYDEIKSAPMPIESLGSLPIDMKFEYLFASINLIFADQNVYASEILFSKKIAMRLGFKKELIDYCVEHHHLHSEEEIKEVSRSMYL